MFGNDPPGRNLGGADQLESSMMRSTKPVFAPHETMRFRKLLLRWYAKHQRKLPWRGQTDPYRILVSEVMLQQTRVAVVEGRYKEFLRQFPSIHKLARAREETVLA